MNLDAMQHPDREVSNRREMHHSRRAFLCAAAAAAPTPPPPYKSTDLSRGKNVYAVGYSHLDTQWRWSYLETIGEYIPKTMKDNFAFFEKYPHYVFNFTGANR